MKRLLALPLSFCFGCSMYMTPPASMPSGVPNDPAGNASDQNCSDGLAAPVVDTLTSVGLGTATVALAVSASQQPYIPVNSNVDPSSGSQRLTKADVMVGTAVITGIGSLLYAASAAHGYKVRSRCIDAKERIAQQEAARQEASRQQAETERQDSSRQLLVEQQQIVQDPMYPACVQVWGTEHCLSPLLFSQYKAEVIAIKERDRAQKEEIERAAQRDEQQRHNAEVEQERQEKVRASQETSRLAQENCTLFIKHRCSPVTTCNTQKRCGMRGNTYTCWGDTQCTETGRFTCREEPPNDCIVAGMSNEFDR